MTYDALFRQHLDARGARAAGRRHQMHRAFGLFPAFQDHLDFAGTDRIADDELGQVGDTETGEQRRHDGLAVVDAQLTGGAHARLLAGRIGVVPDAGRGEIGVTEASVVGEVHRMRRPAVALEIRRRRHGVARHGAEPSRDQRGIRQPGDAQTRIEAVAENVYRIYDEGSTSGTWVNFNQVTSAEGHELTTGDVINLGRVKLKFKKARQAKRVA